MSLNLRKATYPCEPISSLTALCATLQTTEDHLRFIANSANSMYRTVKPKPGSLRQVFDAHAPLKAIHARIKSAILSKVEFPDYLTGSLSGRDYKTNATLHINKAVVICEDVKGFFNSVSDALVNELWLGFFRFKPEVAALLTKLTTKNGSLPQGGITSSYLANLVLWRDEPVLHAKLSARGITYSRYVDDMAMSSNSRLTTDEKTKLIADVYGMLRKRGLFAKRDKHEIMPATKRMITTKLLVNRKAALPPEHRSKVRSEVFKAEQMANGGTDPQFAAKALDKAGNRVGQLGRFHPNLARPLKTRVKAARQRLAASLSTHSEPSLPTALDPVHKIPPWVD